MQKNKDLPASAVHPIQDKFGQVILMTGFTKQEAVALEIFKAMIMQEYSDHPEDVKYMIREAYEWAEQFCDYLENKSEKESGLIQSV
jgi:hypothetical protein